MPKQPLPSKIICYHCGSYQTSKSGFSKSGKPRLLCGSCRRYSSYDPETQAAQMSRRDMQAQSLPGKSRLALELQAIAQHLGKTPTTADIRKLSKTGRVFSIHTYYKVFGSFLEALTLARLIAPPDEDLEKKILLGELRALHEKLQRPLIERDVVAARKKGKVSSIYKFEKVFGSVPKALAAAGIGRKIGYSREELIRILRRIGAAQDRPVTDTDIDRWHKSGRSPSSRSFEREFGGIAKARLAAGVLNVYRREGKDSRTWQRYTIEELLLQLQALGKRLGRRPTDRDINRASQAGLCASAVTFSRVFGSLPNACRKAGFEKVKPRFYTDQEIISILKKMVQEKGSMPTYREINAASKAGISPSSGVILKRFGRQIELKKLLNL